MYLNVLNPLTGYASMGQVQHVAPVAASPGGTIERGTLMKLDSGEFKVASVPGSSTTMGDFVYLALIPVSDYHALMAGVGGAGSVPVANARPVLTGLAISPTLEIETDMFTGTPAVGTYLTIGDGANGTTVGKFCAHANSGETVIGQVIKAAASKWVNNAAAVTGWRTGGQLSVITIRTMYVPQFAI